MKTQTFRDLIVWQHASELAVGIYSNFRDNKDYGFRDQIQRASVSVMNNIAEGYARKSDKSFRHFLTISKGSAAEVESMVVLAEKLGYIDAEAVIDLTNQVQTIQKLLSSFIKSLPAKYQGLGTVDL